MGNTVSAHHSLVTFIFKGFFAMEMSVIRLHCERYLISM